MSTIELKDLFLDLQAELRQQLSTTRRHVPHPGTKGDASEQHWLEMLEAYMPHRYQLTSGQVVDSNGSLSHQIDVIIHDRQYTPFIFNHSGTHYVPAESVYAIFEVKQTFNRKQLKYAGDKAASVRGLHRTSAPIVHAGGAYTTPKPPPPILAGLLALESEWAEPLGPTFQSALDDLTGDRRLDLGCALTHGAFERCADGALVITSAEFALAGFFLTLLARLQAVGTVSAIDLRTYLSALSR